MEIKPAFAGLKVIDISQGIAGPLAGMLLAQHGAQVIKIENTEAGDWARTTGGGKGASPGGHSALSVMGNLGKRSISLDLKSGRGRELLWKLIEDADVVMEGFRPKVIERLGFGYAAVAKRNPRAIYLSLSGFGQSGPLRDRPATDPILQAFTGIMANNAGPGGKPQNVRSIPVDVMTALFAFQAIATALYSRLDQPHGRYIEISLIECAAWLNLYSMLQGLLNDGSPPARRPPNDVFETSDGWVVISILEHRPWQEFCNAIERPELGDDPRFATPASRTENGDELLRQVRTAFKAKPNAYWCDRLTKFNILNSEVKTSAEFLDDPAVVASGIFERLHQHGIAMPLPIPRIPGLPGFEDGTELARAPLAGEHTEAILREHGLTAEEIADLRASKVIQQPAL